MSFKCVSSRILLELREENKKQLNILKAIDEYEEGGDSEEQENQKASNQEELLYQGFENKKSLQIKPLNMFKDAITLRKENLEKRQQVKNLEKLNDQLRSQYQFSITHNKKLQNFLKEVEFTFQQDHKKAKASDVILRARRTLFQEAREAKDRLKRMFRNNEASTIQELKVYISTLEGERQRLKGMVGQQRQFVIKRMQEQDFNSTQIKQLESAFEKIKFSLNQIYDRINQRREQYKIQKMEIKRMIKIRDLDSKKASLKNEVQTVKNLSLESEGLEYQIELLRHRFKDRKKEMSEYEQLRERIQQKHSTIIRLEKQLREKNKTFDYMLQWTKELKKQLEERKLDHTKKKAEFEGQINTLSEEYEKCSQNYKAGLFEEQVARRKGPRDPQPQTLIKTNSIGRQVTILEIQYVVKSLTFQLLQKRVNVEKFIEALLKNTAPEGQKKEGRRVKLKSSMSIQSFSTKEIITVNQLAENLKNSGYEIPQQLTLRIARFVVEDGSGKAEEQASVSIAVAKQVLKKLLERQLETFSDVIEATRELRKLLTTQIDSIRHQLKIAGGKEEQIGIDILRDIFMRYGATPYLSNLFSELLEFYGWTKRKQTCLIRLQDFDEIAAKIKQENQECLLHLIQ